ncbi:MAG: hypothetical protein HC765_08645 [Brachymonas sp.]|nr:hypothetical protein [Brachymonas sp.]
MLAGTLALMSAYAHGACRAHQNLISGKIQSNLCCLQAQNALSPEFRKVLAQVGSSWQQHQLMQLEGQLPAVLPGAQSFSVGAHRTVQ